MSFINLVLTHTAANEIKKLFEQRPSKALGVRIIAYKDGSEIIYNMSFADEVMESDVCFDVDEIPFIASNSILVFLENTQIDFVTIGNASGFVFQNVCSQGSRSCFNCNGVCCGRTSA